MDHFQEISDKERSIGLMIPVVRKFNQAVPTEYPTTSAKNVIKIISQIFITVFLET